MRYAFLALTILLMAGGQVLFKIAAGKINGTTLGFIFDPVFVIALSVYGVATIAWILTLRQWPITVAYPATSLSIVLVVLAGLFVFDETLSYIHIAALCTILIGVLMLALA